MGLWDWFRSRRTSDAGSPEPLDPLYFGVNGQRQLANEGRATLPQFQVSARAVTRSGASSPMRFKMRSAFTPSQPVSDIRMFAGRRLILRNLIRAIEDQQMHVVLYGDRGIGKTSTLHVLTHLAREAKYLVRYTSCSEASDFSETFRAIARDIPLLYHSDIDPTAPEAEQGGKLADLLPPGQLTVAIVADLLAQLRDVRVLIILDEFDRSDSLNFRRWVAELIKNLSDRSTRVQIVIAGVAANLTELIHFIPSIRRNIIGLPLPNMRREELEELVKIGSATSGLPYSHDALDGIAELAGGSPYLASLLGQHAGIAALDRDAAIVEKSDIDFAVERALEEVEGRISPHTRYQIGLVTDSEQRRALAGFARDALANIGQIHAAAPDGEDAAGRDSALHDFSGPNGLLEPLTDLPGNSFRFREEGTALFIWLLNASERFARAARTQEAI
jgi:hypothetical protein